MPCVLLHASPVREESGLFQNYVFFETTDQQLHFPRMFVQIRLRASLMGQKDCVILPQLSARLGLRKGHGDARRLTMYLATLDCAISNPSLSGSPWMRGAPQSGFSTVIRRINTRSSVSICGRPPCGRDFQRQ
jgi:hypothetical protein